jgi:hypothetical protein
MKRILAVGLTLVIALFALSCQKISDTVVEDLTYSNNPDWSGSVWSGDGNETVITKRVVSVAVNGSETRTETLIPVVAKKQTLTLNADKTFTLVTTDTFTADAEKNYVSDNYNYAIANVEPYVVPARANDYTAYYIDNTEKYWVAGQNGSIANLLNQVDLYTIGATNVTYNNNATRFAVTFVTLAADKLNGQTVSSTTISGTWETYTSTNNPVDDTSRIRMLPVSKTTTDYDYSVNPATTTTVSSTYASTEVWTATANKALDPAGKDSYYVDWDLNLFLTKK